MNLFSSTPWLQLDSIGTRDIRNAEAQAKNRPKNCGVILRTSNRPLLRTQYNKSFIEQELKTYDTFFSNIENRKLDLQQRTAIITDEDNYLVIAGAGSGKTTTIVGKARYILDRYKVNPDEILLISFTKNAASTLAERINVKGIEAKTFHKLGKDIIVACEAPKIPI